MIRFFPNTKTFLEIGPFQIAWYAVFILSGALIAYQISLRNLKKVGYVENEVEGLFFGGLLTGLLGARLWYVLFFDLSAYLKEPLRIFAMWEGGMAIQGGLIAGFAYGYYYTKKHKFNFWQWADLIIPNILLAQAIGRWGNFMNQEAFGRIVHESYYRYFPNFIKSMMLIDGAYREPTFLYESIANIVGWILIVLVLKRFTQIKRGDLSFAYLIWYGMTRFFIEGFRSDSLMFFGLRIAQVISLIFVLVGLMGYYGVFRKYMSTDQKPVLLFDFDGTLMDTESSIKAAAKASLEKFAPDLEISQEILDGFIGPDLYQSFSKYIQKEELEEVVEYYRQANLQLHPQLVRPFPHALELLESLKVQGYDLGIVSSKSQAAMSWPLKEFKMEKYFPVIVGYDEVEHTKPNPEGILKALAALGRGRDQVIYIGDQLTDVQAGIRAGSFTIAFRPEASDEDIELKENANRFIRDLASIENILKEDHEWTRTEQ